MEMVDETIVTYDVIIVGAGVAGSALAYALAKDGRSVRLIERDLAAPDRIAGEYLQPGGYIKLLELDLQDCVEEIDAQRMFGYALTKDDKSALIPYPLENFGSDKSGWCFHNGRFVQRMRWKAASLANVTLEQGSVTALIEENGMVRGVRYRKNGGDFEAFAPLTIVCDGCSSNLRCSLSSPKVDVPSWFVGLILENCQLPIPNYGHIIIADPSPIIIYPISSTEIRFLVDIPGPKLPSVLDGEMSEYLKSVVACQVPRQLQEALITAIDKGRFRTMPNKIMPAAPRPPPGALLFGDALNMRSALTGGGMTVALSDVVILRDLLRATHDISDAPALSKYLESFYTLRKPMASTINLLANTLSAVFIASHDEARNELRQACFEYLSLEGICSEGPALLLSGLNPNPVILLCHLFAIAVYAMIRLFLPFPSPNRLWLSTRLLLVALGIILPIIKSEGVRQMLFPMTIPAYYYRAPATAASVSAKRW